jgi:hypothetical protein
MMDYSLGTEGMLKKTLAIFTLKMAGVFADRIRTAATGVTFSWLFCVFCPCGREPYDHPVMVLLLRAAFFGDSRTMSRAIHTFAGFNSALFLAEYWPLAGDKEPVGQDVCGPMLFSKQNDTLEVFSENVTPWTRDG